MDADVIVFNPQTVADQATFTAPYLPSTGMRYVLVNGVPIIEDGKLLTNSIPGRPVRREITVQ
jgi:N-acyl-D-aspartate/D-glutamate deacylase